MKLLYLFFLLSLVKSYSQGFCEYGDYEFLFNTITGVDKSQFKKIELKNKNKILSVENNDDYGKLKDSNYNESIGFFGTDFRGEDNPCYPPYLFNIEQKVHVYKYEYFEDMRIKKIYIYSNNKLEGVKIFTYNSHNKIETIKGEHLDILHTYDTKGRLKQINRNGKIFKFLWNKKNQLKKIAVIPSAYAFDRYSTFKYSSDNTINSITIKYYDKDIKGKAAEFKKKFYYKNQKINMIVSTGKYKSDKKKTSFYYKFDYSKKNKVIIEILNDKKEYLEHFECYF